MQWGWERWQSDLHRRAPAQPHNRMRAKFNYSPLGVARAWYPPFPYHQCLRCWDKVVCSIGGLPFVWLVYTAFNQLRVDSCLLRVFVWTMLRRLTSSSCIPHAIVHCLWTVLRNLLLVLCLGVSPWFLLRFVLLALWFVLPAVCTAHSALCSALSAICPALVSAPFCTLRTPIWARRVLRCSVCGPYRAFCIPLARLHKIPAWHSFDPGSVQPPPPQTPAPVSHA